MNWKDFKKIDTSVLPIDVADVINLEFHEFEKTYTEIISKSLARPYDVELINKFTKLSKRKRYKIHKWLERIDKNGSK